jgi:hypothetical protein
MALKRSNKQKKSSKSRRWFVAASGWGLNLDVGSGEKSSKTRRSEFSQKDTAAFYTLTNNIAAGNFLQNTIYTHNIAGSIVQGTADSNRVGDYIHIDTVSLKFLLDTSTATNPSFSFVMRTMLIAITTQYNATGFVAGVGSTDLFYSSTPPLTVARVNPKLCKVLCDDLIYIRPRINATSDVAIQHVECRLNQPFEYRTGAIYGTAANLYLLMIPYQAGGTSGVTQCGQFSYDINVSFEEK